MPDGDGDRSLVGDAAEGTARVGIAVSWFSLLGRARQWREYGHDGGVYWAIDTRHNVLTLT